MFSTAKLSEKTMAEFKANGGTTSTIEVGEAKLERGPQLTPPVQAKRPGGVVVDAGRRVAVPSFSGAGLRKVIEDAGALGLRVEPVGSGLAREQVPAAGTMVPNGTQVVVRFSR
jgi:cell division protein FtsI (penicillin-binding protein 3)